VLYRIGLLKATRLPVPVIIVGNLVAGGAGKTPTVIALVRHLRARGHLPGIVSRGYGRSADTLLDVQPDTPVSEAGDEPLLLRLRTGAPVVVGRDRAAAGRALLRRHPAVDVLVGDDGLQHHRLARDLQLLVFDERGAGNGWLLPAGPLREPMAKAPPADTLVLYNAAAPSTPWPGALARRGLSGVSLLEDWWRGQAPSLAALEGLRGRGLLAVAGLARPDRFFEMLRAQGLTVDTLTLPDHDAYTTLPWPADTAEVIVTEKDAVKLQPGRSGATRVWVATLDFGFDTGFTAALDAALAHRLPPLVQPPLESTESDHGNTPA
jgi:tetraacyldisaccharide 4'-kinase